ENARPSEGVFMLEEKSIKKTAEAEFEATKEVDKGEKATGTITVKLPAGTVITHAQREAGLTINAGTTFVFGEIAFVATEGRSITEDDIGMVCPRGKSCTTNEDVSFGAIPVVATENGDKYNIAATTNGWSLNSTAWYAGSLKFASSEMTGGTSKMVKVVSKEDLENAKSSLSLPSNTEIVNDLSKEFGDGYFVINDSFTSDEAKYTNTPDIDGEVEEGKKAKISVEKNYKIYAVKRSDINDYIMTKASESIGDDTQSVYWTGVTGFSKDVIKNSNSVKKDKVFFENFSKGDEMSAKLKSTVFVGPEITEDMVYEKALGKKTGEVQTAIKSINGVSEVSVKTSYFWVHKIPDDKSKVHIDVSLVE
ncbi:MAG: hypothetical protein Q4A96_03745, partial [Candidatus Saccharibacteria bacterium]|nr:hypothetical protein [Candidatus Saccharibacteria bacterium]